MNVIKVIEDFTYWTGKLSQGYEEWQIWRIQAVQEWILKANWVEGKFRGITVPRGSFVSTVSKLAEETKLTNDEVRTAISHLYKDNIVKLVFSIHNVDWL